MACIDGHKRISILGVQIDDLKFDEALCLIEDGINKTARLAVTTPNVHHIILLQKDDEFRKVYRDAYLSLPDGMPLIWASRFLGTPLKERISGADLFPKLCDIAARKGYRLFFLGGREGAASGAARILKERYPEIKITGYYCPPLGFENNPAENEKIVKMIRDASPDILFVGLGAPKQEKWIYKHKDACGVPVSIGVGVTFEFIGGMVKRAPLWMQKSGLEWLWRLAMEPGRLWKRYLIDDMRFFWLVLKQKAGRPGGK